MRRFQCAETGKRGLRRRVRSVVRNKRGGVVRPPRLRCYRVTRYPSGSSPSWSNSGLKRRGAPVKDGSQVARSAGCGRITSSPLSMSSRTLSRRRSPIGKSSLRHSSLASSSGRTRHQSCAAIGPPSTVSDSQKTVPPAMRSRSRIVHRTASRPLCRGSRDG